MFVREIETGRKKPLKANLYVIRLDLPRCRDIAFPTDESRCFTAGEDNSPRADE